MMPLWMSLSFPVFLLLASCAFIYWHIRSWREVSAQDLDSREMDYCWRQFRRRMQCSALLVVLAVMMIVGQWIKSPAIVVVLFWCGALLLLAWLTLLVLVDVIVTIHHFQNLRADCLVEQAKLKAEEKRIRASTGGNGQAKGGKPPLGG